MEKAHVDKRLLIGLGGVAGASLLAVAFLLGKASSSGPAATPAGRPLPGDAISADAVPRGPDAAPPPTALPAVPVSQAATIPTATAGLASDFAPPPRIAPPGVAAPPAAFDAARSTSDPERDAVAAYLEAVGKAQTGKMEGDAESVANEMAVALAKGDVSGLEKLIRETEEAKAKLTALSPPAGCAAHYRESLGSLDDALEMLRGVKTAMESPDPATRLAEVGTRATALRSRAEALQREEQALRDRHHLPR